jgi:N,N'-diacetyllegionaminate synthase
MVKKVREAEKALGDGIKKPTKNEEKIKKIVRKSILAKKDIPGDAVITEDMLIIKRPGIGIKPKYLNKIIGKKAKKDIKKDSLIRFADLI